ncbi:MAG: hypothetical protein AAF720_04515 [Pseudomonadota bacterium]
MNKHVNEKPIRQIASELTDILDQERNALITGDYATVNNLIDEKRCLAEAFERLVAPTDAISAQIEKLDEPSAIKLQEALARNEAMLSGARNGIEQARKRLAVLSRKSNEVGVYDASGDRPQMNGGSSASGRRA